jgi:hypothetical protein
MDAAVDADGSSRGVRPHVSETSLEPVQEAHPHTTPLIKPLIAAR